MYSLPLLVAAVLVGCGPVWGEEGPKCDPKVVGDLKKYFPGGIPQDIVGRIYKTGPYSFLSVSAPNAQAMGGEQATCVGFKINDDQKTAKVTKKLSQGAVSADYTVVEEKDAAISYLSATDIAPKYKIYHLFVKDGVLVTYRCCETCSGSALNVGIAVADKQLNSPATQLAVSEAKQLLKDNQLDANLVDLKPCSA